MGACHPQISPSNHGIRPAADQDIPLFQPVPVGGGPCGTDPVSRGYRYLASFAPGPACHFGDNRTMLSFPDWHADAEPRIAVTHGPLWLHSGMGPPILVFGLSSQDTKRETDQGQAVECRLGAPRPLAAPLQSGVQSIKLARLIPLGVGCQRNLIHRVFGR